MIERRRADDRRGRRRRSCDEESKIQIYRFQGQCSIKDIY